MNVPPLNLFSQADWYRTILDQVQHEDNLIVQRLFSETDVGPPKQEFLLKSLRALARGVLLTDWRHIRFFLPGMLPSRWS